MVNLYCHFPFCRRKCAYCALHSRAGSTKSARDAYARCLAEEIRERVTEPVDTVYFGGGTPVMCDLTPVCEALNERGFAPGYEFTVELNPADVIDDPSLPERLAAGGVNRVSMGFEALDDATLRLLGRAHTVREAMAAFKMVKAVIPNCGFDLIAGLPSASQIDGTCAAPESQAGGAGAAAPLQVAGANDAPTTLARVVEELEPVHVSVYSLIREPGTLLDKLVSRGEMSLPDDDDALDEVAKFAATLAEAGLERYEISNYARPGFECRHNLAVWKGEDYFGLGEGAHGREGANRTVGKRFEKFEKFERFERFEWFEKFEKLGEFERFEKLRWLGKRDRGVDKTNSINLSNLSNFSNLSNLRPWIYSSEKLSAEADALERELFSLRTFIGFDPEAVVARHPVLAPRLASWRKELEFNLQQGLLASSGTTYTLTPRGFEVCDAILESLMA